MSNYIQLYSTVASRTELKDIKEQLQALDVSALSAPQ